MKKNNLKKIAKNVIDLEIQALKSLKNSINNSFNKAVSLISNCQSKVIFCGVGKSFIIASKISSTLSSVGSPSFAISASQCSHGDLGSITKKDLLILISNSGETEELKPVIQYAKRNKIVLVGIVSKKNSVLYKSSDVKLYIPESKESGHGIVPTSSTTSQLALGDALAIASMNYKNFGKLDFKRFHPSGNLATKLKTVEDLMITGSKIPFVKDNLNMRSAIKILSNKKLGVLIVQNQQKKTIGVITDGQIRRFNHTKIDFTSLKVADVMTKNPICIDKNALAAKALALMNNKKI